MARAAGLSALCLVALMGCEANVPRAIPTPEPRPADLIPAPMVERRTAESIDLETYYTRVEESLVTRGFLREEGGGIDAPWDGEMLQAAFLRTALFQEYTEIDGRLVLRESPNKLRRWTEPVKIEPRFGPLVSDERKAQDLDFIRNYAERLTRVTGHPVRVVTSGGNFPVLIVHDAERKRSDDTLRAAIPGLPDSAVAAVRDLTRATYCTLLVSDANDDGRITNAVSIIRAELPGRLRRACIHEEIAQGLGLTNDTGDARPSLFSDDDEWGRLTELDAALLRLHYHPDMRPGMTAEEALPVAARLAPAFAPDPAS